jgi:multidrug efflux pump subunit AcrB
MTAKTEKATNANVTKATDATPVVDDSSVQDLDLPMLKNLFPTAKDCDLNAFAAKLQRASDAFETAKSLDDVLAAFKKEGVTVSVKLDKEAKELLGINTKVNWKLIGAWLGGGVALIAVTYAGYKIYVKTKAKAANSDGLSVTM